MTAPERHAPNPNCHQCHGTGRTQYQVWLTDNTWESTEEVDCYCTFTPSAKIASEPFPSRPDNGDGLPDPDRITYARSDYYL